MEEESKELTNQQKKFCEEYILDWNGARAARDAGYSENTAREQASRLLTKVHIEAYIKEIQDDLQKQAGISRLSNVNVLKKIIDDKKADFRDKMKAIEVVNKMLGFNAPEQKDVTSGGKPVEGIGLIEWVD